MGAGKSLVIFEMAASASGLVKGRGIPDDVAVATGERRAIAASLVGSQYERGAGVVERCGGTPPGGSMTILAAAAQTASVRIAPRVAGKALGWGASERLIGMTGLADNVGMPAFERETELGMVNRRVPAVGGVTGSAIGAESAVVNIIFLVA